MDKPKTIIIDVDGVIFQHGNWWADTPSLPGIKEAFHEWERKGYCIVIMTARPECMRPELEERLKKNHLFWNHLVMGVSSGERVVINDAKPSGRCASAHAVERNGDFDLQI